MKKLQQLLITVVALLFTGIPFHSFGQSTSANNTPFSGKFLGYDGPQDLDFKTDDILRMQLMRTQTSTINGFTGVAQDGFLGISDQANFFNPAGTGPFSMLHLNGDNAGSNPQELGWRPWMHYGMTVTSNRDLMYIGHLDRGTTDETDAVITWSDNTLGPAGPDNLRFLFTSGDGTAPPGDEDSFYGLEAGRFSGLGRFGCGDFSPSGANEQPTHQLDVNGRTRLRDVPGLAGNVLITGRQVDAIGDYMLTYLYFPLDESVYLNGAGEWSTPEALDCRWQDVNSITIPGETDIFTGLDPEADCYRGKVGIGQNQMRSKLGVTNFLERDAVFTGIYGRSSGDGDNTSQSMVGVHGVSDSDGELGSSFIHNGVLGEGFDARYTVGVRGIGHALEASTSAAFGVRGEASGAADFNAAIYGEVTAAGDYSGYFVGGMFTTTGVPIVISDESVKNTVQSVENASSILSQLQPKTYFYQSPENRAIAFQESLQYGFIAQEIQEILPDIVKAVTIPELMDSTGVVEGTSVDLLGVQYEALIPILVAGFNEQQQTISSLEDVIDSQNQTLAQVLDQLDDLQQQINSCCSADGAKSFGSQDEESNPVFGENILHQNSPNPFRSQTTISYELEQGGKVMLNIFDRNGKPLATLVEAEQQAGEYRYEWDASGLPAGVYNYALYVDGELLVKKAIKLAD